jgi:hypothetical protein
LLALAGEVWVEDHPVLVEEVQLRLPCLLLVVRRRIDETLAPQRGQQQPVQRRVHLGERPAALFGALEREALGGSGQSGIAGAVAAVATH